MHDCMDSIIICLQDMSWIQYTHTRISLFLSLGLRTVGGQVSPCYLLHQSSVARIGRRPSTHQLLDRAQHRLFFFFISLHWSYINTILMHLHDHEHQPHMITKQLAFSFRCTIYHILVLSASTIDVQCSSACMCSNPTTYCTDRPFLFLKLKTCISSVTHIHEYSKRNHGIYSSGHACLFFGF